MNEEEKEDFVQRCKMLGVMLSRLERMESSPRVWISVMVEIIKGIILQEKEPESALKQVIECLQRVDDENA